MQTSNDTVQAVNIVRTEVIEAPPAIVFQSVLDQLGPESQMPGGQPFPMKFEAWPGGRWFRDLGNHTGHLWGHVQVIKPPTLLEVCGPMFMSFAATNFIQYRLVAEGAITKMTFTHQAIGLIPKQFQEEMGKGWDYWVQRIRDLSAQRASKK